VEKSGVGPDEPPFVGERRIALVDSLMVEFDQVCRSRTPRWWSLEAHSGWGKTRVVQEFYRRLAAERQSGAHYWPPSILPEASIVTRAGPSTFLRKRVYPEQVVRDPEAAPQWFWWGISCATRSGAPVQALADDLTQFAAHQEALETRWNELASRRARLGARLLPKKGEVVETAAGEIVGAAAGLANLAVPGLGLLTLMAKWGVQGVRSGRRAGQVSPVLDAGGSGRSDLVEELAPALERLAAAGLPIVITIEDLHLADESLGELMSRLLAAQGAPVLMISTAWRGLLDEDDRPAHRLIKRVQPDRVCRVLADEDLPDLAPGERQVIARSTLPGVSERNAELLAASYTNPLALQLACNVGWVRRAQHDLTADDVAALPRNVDGLFTRLWSELPDEARQALMVAALSTPTGISKSMGFGDARWDSSLLAVVSETEAWLRASAGNLSVVLGQTSDVYAWIRTVDECLRRFQDPGQHEVAVRKARVEYHHEERRLLYLAMARGIAAGGPKPPSQELHQARLLVALTNEGFLTWDQATLAGAVTLCRSLLAEPDVDSRRYTIRTVESALRSAGIESPAAGPMLTLREQHASALGESGRFAEAITELEQLLADRLRVLGPDARETLRTRSNLAELLGRSGRVVEALTVCRLLLVDRTRALGPDDPDTLRTRDNLAGWLGRSGRVAEALTAYQQLLADQLRVLGPAAPDTLKTRNNLARWLGRSGRVSEGLAACRQLLADRTRVLGPDAPDTLTTRYNLTELVAWSGRVAEALAACRQLLADRTRVLGPDAPDTLTARNNVAELLGRSGRLAEAIPAFEQLVADRTRVLGPDSPYTLTTRDNLAKWLGRSERPAEGLRLCEQVLADRTRVLGPDDPDTLTTRNNLAEMLGRSGRVTEGLAACRQLLFDRTRVLGPDAPDTLTTRNNLAELLGRSGRVAEGLAACQRLLVDRTRVLGPDSPHTLTTRNNLAELLGRSGRVAEAIAVCEQLLADQLRVLGPDAPDTQTTRKSLGRLERSRPDS
jgi:tetratricopeptide (TPR) repeat protein